MEIGWERSIYYTNETYGSVEVCGIVYNMLLSRSETVRVETSDGTAGESTVHVHT